MLVSSLDNDLNWSCTAGVVVPRPSKTREHSRPMMARASLESTANAGYAIGGARASGSRRPRLGVDGAVAVLRVSVDAEVDQGWSEDRDGGAREGEAQVGRLD